jgi:hypothetical protein
MLEARSAMQVDIRDYWFKSSKDMEAIRKLVAPVIFYAYDSVLTYLVKGTIIVEDSYYCGCPDCNGHTEDREIEVEELVNARCADEAVNLVADQVMDDELVYGDVPDLYPQYRWKEKSVAEPWFPKMHEKAMRDKEAK